jgi:hypothetical protein
LMSKSPPARIAWSADCVFGLVQARLAGIQQDRPELTCSVFTVCTVYFALWFVIVQVKMALVIFAFFLHRLYFLRVSLGTKREREDGLSPRKLQWIAWELLWQTEGVNVSAPQKTHTLNHKYVRRYGVQLGLFATSLKTDLALATMSTVSCHYSIRPSWHTLCKNQDPTRKA